MTGDAAVTQLVVLLLSAACIVYGILGLLGRDLYLPTRGGSAQHVTGLSARVAGGILFVLGSYLLLRMFDLI